MNVFVEAGAGTGKTHDLVGRVTELVASGMATSRGLVAITFTEAAAAELRDRVRRGLEEAADDVGRAEVERRRCASALERLDAAAITTIHGFAMRILAEHAGPAGLPDDFEVLDDVQAELRFQERWEARLPELLDEGPHRSAFARALALGGKLGDLRDIARALCDRWDRVLQLQSSGGELGPVDLGRIDERIRAALDAAAQAQGTRLGSRTLEELGPFGERFSRVVESKGEGSLRALAMVVQDLPDIKVGGATPAAAGGVRAALDALSDERRALVSSLATEVLAAVLAPLASFALETAEERRREGLLEYHDLLVRAVLLLRSRPEVRRELTEWIDALLIDELQDTDPLQAEMAELLGATHRCFVGDPKQSIYRFRGADLAVYERMRESFAAEVVTLSRNHRSVPGVLDWVNAVFGELMGREEGQAQFTPLVAARGTGPMDEIWPGGDGSGPAVIGIGGAHREGRVAELRQLEAAQMAKLVTELVDGGSTVSDGQGGQRPIRFDDVAVLLPTRAALAAVEQGFELAGVPYRIESRSLLFGTDEVHDVLVVLAALDDPDDEVSVVAALKGLAFACSDADLLGWRMAGGTWRASGEEVEVPEGVSPEHPVADSLRELGAMRAAAVGLPANLVVDMVIRRCRLTELAATSSRPRDRWRRYRLLLDEARSFVEGGGEELGDFVEWIRSQADAGATRLEVAAPEEDDHAVRILTVHGAKGLEFPVVMLTGLNAVPATSAPALLWVDGKPELKMGLMANGFRTAGYAEALAEERRQEELERCRLLYVAATRARDLLVVGLHHRQRTNCLARRLVDLEEGERHLPWRRDLALSLDGEGSQLVHRM